MTILIPTMIGTLVLKGKEVALGHVQEDETRIDVEGQDHAPGHVHGKFKKEISFHSYPKIVENLQASTF